MDNLTEESVTANKETQTRLHGVRFSIGSEHADRLAGTRLSL